MFQHPAPVSFVPERLQIADIQVDSTVEDTSLAGVVHRLAILGGLPGVAAASWRVYQRYRVHQSMQIQYNRARAAASRRGQALDCEHVNWLQLSRYKFDAVWEDRETLADMAGLLPMQALCASFAGGQQDFPNVADHLLVALVDAGLVTEEVLTHRFLPQATSAIEISRLANSAEAGLSILAAAIAGVDPQSARAETFISELAATLDIPEGLVSGLRIRLQRTPELPLVS